MQVSITIPKTWNPHDKDAYNKWQEKIQNYTKQNKY